MANFMQDQGGKYVYAIDAQLLEQEFTNLAISYL